MLKKFETIEIKKTIDKINLNALKEVYHINIEVFNQYFNENVKLMNDLCQSAFKSTENLVNFIHTYKNTEKNFILLVRKIKALIVDNILLNQYCPFFLNQSFKDEVFKLIDLITILSNDKVVPKPANIEEYNCWQDIQILKILYVTIYKANTATGWTSP